MKDGSVVSGLYKLDATNAKLYTCSGIVVTGEHKILENGSFIEVAASRICQPLVLSLPVVYDLDTTSHRIHVQTSLSQNIVFADYSEVNKMKRIEKIELRKLNN